MITISYTCKFCQTPRSFQFEDPDNGMSLVEIDKWKPMLACDRCADFERARRDLEESAFKQGWAMMVLRQQLRPGSKRLLDSETAAKANFTEITQRYMKLVSNHFGVEYEWHDGWVVFMLKAPQNAASEMRRYLRSAKQQTQLAGV